jgi:hypothetical protein
MAQTVVDFLDATFMRLTYLPLAAREAAHFTCCSHVGGGFLKVRPCVVHTCPFPTPRVATHTNI